MDSKKVNAFAIIMIIVMCIFSVYVSTNNSKAKDGVDGRDGIDMSIISVYNDYKNENPTYSGSLADFIEEYLGDKFSFVDEISKQQLSAQTALCSTVDICFSYYMDSYYSASESTATFGGEEKNIYLISKSNKPLMSVAAGSGVIYKKTTEGTKHTAYIITNYHVVYVEGYSNDPNYEVFKTSNGSYFTRKIDNNKIYQYGFYNYIIKDEIEKAPVDVHFLDSYKIYLNGYQSKDSALNATFVGGSAENDIAVLKIEYDSAVDAESNNKLIFEGPFVEAKISDSDDIQELDYVIPVGNPLIPNTSDIDMTKISTYEQYLEAIEESYINSLCLTTTGGRISQVSCKMPFSSIIDEKK